MKNLINASRSQSLGIFPILCVHTCWEKLCIVFIEKAAVFSDTALFYCNFTILLRSLLIAYLLQSRNKGTGAINLDISCLISISLYKRNYIVEKWNTPIVSYSEFYSSRAWCQMHVMAFMYWRKWSNNIVVFLQLYRGTFALFSIWPY